MTSSIPAMGNDCQGVHLKWTGFTTLTSLTPQVQPSHKKRLAVCNAAMKKLMRPRSRHLSCILWAGKPTIMTFNDSKNSRKIFLWKKCYNCGYCIRINQWLTPSVLALALAKFYFPDPWSKFGVTVKYLKYLTRARWWTDDDRKRPYRTGQMIV